MIVKISNILKKIYRKTPLLRLTTYNLRLFVLLVLAATSCRQGLRPKAEPGEGTVTYRVTYPDSMHYGLKAKLFPHEINLIFKDEKATFIASGALGMIQMVNLLDHKNYHYTSLLIDDLRGNYGCRLTKEEIKKNESRPQFDYRFTEETKTIAGRTCRKAIVTDQSDGKFEFWYDPTLKFYYLNSPFADFGYLMLEYSHTMNDLTMHLEATRVDLSTPVDTTMFNIKGDYNWLDEKQFYSYLEKL